MDQKIVPIVYFLIFLFVEVMTTAWFIESFGGFAFFVEIIASAMIGMTLIATMQGHIFEQARSIMAGKTDESDLIRSSTARFIGGVLLVIPGVFTDLLAIVIQLPFVGRAFIRKTVVKKPKKGDVIDVEVIDSGSSRS